MSFVRTEAAGAARRPALALALALAIPILASACGGTARRPPTSASTASTAGSPAGASLSCTTGASSSGPDRVAVVVQASASSVVSRCLQVGRGGVSALSALRAAKVEVGTQQYSFGLGICQVDNVPAHYSSCIPAGASYWALFVAHGTSRWVSSPTGVSGISLEPGDSLGLRYDPPKGTAPAPSIPPPVT